jgi:hypothetical protein
MLGHASAAMTLDIYAASLPTTSTPLRTSSTRAFARLNADQMWTKRRPKRSNQAALPFQTLP